MAKVEIMYQPVSVVRAGKSGTAHRVTLTVPSGTQRKSGHVDVGSAKEARQLVELKLNEAAEAGQYPVIVKMLDKTGGGFKGTYTADGRLVEEKIDAPGGILGPKCSSVPRPKAKQTSAAGHTSVRERGEVTRARNTWGHLYAKLKKGEVSVKLVKGSPVLAKGPKKGWTTAGPEHFEVIAALIISKAEGYKGLGSYSPILVKPSSMVKQANLETVLKALGAGGTSARKPSKAPKKPSKKPATARKPSPAKPSAKKPSARKPSPAKPSPRKPSVKPPASSARKPSGPKKPSAKPRNAVEAYLRKTDNGTDFDAAVAYLSKLVPKVRAGVLNGLPKAKGVSSAARKVGSQLKAHFAAGKTVKPKKPSAKKPSVRTSSTSRKPSSSSARKPSGPKKPSGSRKPSKPSGSKRPSLTRMGAAEPSARRPSSSPMGPSPKRTSPRQPSNRKPKMGLSDLLAEMEDLM